MNKIRVGDMTISPDSQALKIIYLLIYWRTLQQKYYVGLVKCVLLMLHISLLNFITWTQKLYVCRYAWV